MTTEKRIVGRTKSQTMNTSEQIDKINEILDDYESTHSIVTPEVSHNLEHIEHFINMPYKHTKALTAEECAEGGYLLSQYSFFVQKEQNKHIALNNWATAKLNDLLCNDIVNFAGIAKHEVKIATLAKENHVAEKLSKIMRHAESITNRLNFLSSNIKHMSDMLINIQRAKKYKMSGEQNDLR